MAEDKIVTTIDYNVKVGKQRLDLLTKAITRVDNAHRYRYSDHKEVRQRH